MCEIVDWNELNTVMWRQEIRL